MRELKKKVGYQKSHHFHTIILIVCVACQRNRYGTIQKPLTDGFYDVDERVLYKHLQYHGYRNGCYEHYKVAIRCQQRYNLRFHAVTRLHLIFICLPAFDTVNDGVIDLTQPKLIYCLGNCISIALAIYKCGSLGLLPTTSADWTWLLPVKLSTEYSVFVGSSLG